MEVAGDVGVAGRVHGDVAAPGVRVGGVIDRHYALEGTVSGVVADQERVVLGAGVECRRRRVCTAGEVDSAPVATGAVDGVACDSDPAAGEVRLVVAAVDRHPLGGA